MPTINLLKPTPWDTAVFGINTFELTEYSEAALQLAATTPGHHTLKVDPLADKQLLHHYGFYYCDTLIEPFCEHDDFTPHDHPKAGIDPHPVLDVLMPICHGAFSHGRFHRDFNLSKDAADRRYDQWLGQLHEKGQVFSLLFEDDPAGFIAYEENRLLLHAVAEPCRGKGIAKHLWSAACRELFSRGHNELSSSISATNLAAANLYASLGFRLRNPVDIYHRLQK